MISTFKWLGYLDNIETKFRSNNSDISVERPVKAAPRLICFYSQAVLNYDTVLWTDKVISCSTARFLS